MKNVQKIDLGLTGYDELFMNDAERKENKLPRIYDVPISEIDDFPDHPFKVKVDEDMLCSRYNVAKDMFRFERLPENISTMDARSMRNELSKIRDVANEISADMAKILEKEMA